MSSNRSATIIPAACRYSAVTSVNAEETILASPVRQVNFITPAAPSNLMGAACRSLGTPVNALDFKRALEFGVRLLVSLEQSCHTVEAPSWSTTSSDHPSRPPANL